MSSNHTIVDWNNYMREVCAQVLLNDPSRIRGPNITVEVDESLFVKRKANVGRIPEKQWMLGGVCRETNDCILCAVPDRTENTGWSRSSYPQKFFEF